MSQLRPRTLIRVGQRVIRWDGIPGYVGTNSQGKNVHGPSEPFHVEWLDADGSVEDAEILTLEQFKAEGIRFGRGLMRWAR